MLTLYAKRDPCFAALRAASDVGLEEAVLLFPAWGSGLSLGCLGVCLGFGSGSSVVLFFPEGLLGGLLEILRFPFPPSVFVSFLGLCLGITMGFSG